MRRSRAIVTGILVGLLGVAVAYATTALLGLRVDPVRAVGEAVIEVTPGGLAESLIQLVGQWDKPLLVTGVLLVVLAATAAAGVLATRRPGAARLVLLGLAAVGLAAALTRPGAGPLDAVPVVVGAVVWLLALELTLPGREYDVTRRSFLVGSAALAVLAVAAAAAGRFLGGARLATEAARDRLRLPVSAGDVPTGADLGGGIEPWRTPNPRFYRIDTALVVPSVDPGEWRLRVHGMVDRELELGYDDLLAREFTEAWVTLCCVSNPVGGGLIGNAWWSGVRVADVLAEAGVRAGADAVLQTSHDGWNCGTPLAVLTDDRDALLAVAMNGEPLPLEHGFPVRMVVPGLYGYVSATKWLVDLEVTRFADFTAYWTQRGWAPRGPVKTQSRIDTPYDGQSVQAGPRRVGGSAWAQHTGITAVEVRLDGGPWRPAELGRVPGADTWVQWVTEVDLAPGRHTLAVRATDRSGYTQTGVHTDVVPDGATGWHTIDVHAR